MGLRTTTLETEMLAPGLMTRSEEKLEPERVTGTVAPGEAVEGETEEREGAGCGPARTSKAQILGLPTTETN